MMELEGFQMSLHCFSMTGWTGRGDGEGYVAFLLPWLLQLDSHVRFTHFPWILMWA